MKKVFRGFILFVIILILQLTLLPANEAYANDNPLTFSELDIKVMPEFINPEGWENTLPSLLVGYHGSVTNESDTPFEGDIIVPIPTTLPQFEITYVAQEVDPATEKHLQLEFTINEQEQYIAIQPQQPIEPNETFNFIIEHFSNSIEGGIERYFTYDYVTSVDIDNLNLAIYAPFRAESFEIDQEPTFTTSSFGVEIFVYELGSISIGEELSFEVSYVKDSIVTTVEAFNDFDMPNDDAHAGLNDPSSPNNQSSNVENILLIGLTVIIIAAFIYIILRKKQSTEKNYQQTRVTPKKIVNKEEEIKKLRKMLADGKIDEKTYKERRTKLG